MIKAAFIPHYILSALAIIAALGVLWAKNVLNAALCLILCLLAIAGLYAVLNAEFLAVTQIMVYAGGVLVLILFGIMITVRTTGMIPEVGSQNQWIGLLTAVSFFLLLVYCLEYLPATLTFNESVVSAHSLGKELMTEFVAPFELSGLLLLVSLIGASLVASYQQKA